MSKVERERQVEVIDNSRGAVECLQCGQRWVYNLRPGGRRPWRWWACPTNRCNVKA